LIDGDVGDSSTANNLIDAALFLVRASFITEEVLYVDGGAHAGKW